MKSLSPRLGNPKITPRTVKEAQARAYFLRGYSALRIVEITGVDIAFANKLKGIH